MIISCFNNFLTSKVLLVLCIFPLVMVPYILDKIKLYHMNEVLIFVYYVFIFLALILGSILGFYHKIWWFDLLCHFTSGCLVSLVGFILLDKNNLINKKYSIFGFIFIIIFTIGIATIWEYFEFIIDKVSGQDVQNVITTGVDDTIEDMLIATFPGIISSIYYLRYINRKSKEGK